MLHRSGLVVVAAPGQGHQLRKRRSERNRKEWINAFANILCIRFKGFDPERFLNGSTPASAGSSRRSTVALCLVLILSAATLVTVQFDVFRHKLPAFHQFFNFPTPCGSPWCCA